MEGEHRGKGQASPHDAAIASACGRA